MRSLSTALRLIAAVLLSSWSARAQDRGASAKETVQFDGQTLVLAHQEGNSRTSFKEFIPAGESLDAWTKLASIFVDRDSENDLEAIIAEGLAGGEPVEKWGYRGPVVPFIDRKTSRNIRVGAVPLYFPFTERNIRRYRKTGSVTIDFPIALMDGERSFVELNVVRYSKFPGRGLMVEQYAVRHHGDVGKIKVILDDLVPGTTSSVTKRLVDLMSTFGLKSLSCGDARVLDQPGIKDFPDFDERSCQLPSNLYPANDRAQGIQGAVVLRVEIDATGRVGDVCVLEGRSESLDRLAVGWMRDKCRFKAAKDRSGHPVPAVIRYTFRFQIDPPP